MTASVTLRAYQSEDRHFVTDSFLRSFGRSAYAEGIAARVLIDLLEPLLISWDVTIAADGDEILGWICSKGTNLVAWIFVKPSYRRAKISRALLAHAGIGPIVSAPFVPTNLLDNPFVTMARE